MFELVTTYLLAQFAGLYAKSRDEDGAVTIEYGVLVAVIALGLVAVGLALVAAISGWFGRIGTEVNSLTP